MKIAFNLSGEMKTEHKLINISIIEIADYIRKHPNCVNTKYITKK